VHDEFLLLALTVHDKKNLLAPTVWMCGTKDFWHHKWGCNIKDLKISGTTSVDGWY
jgi:hypothetical protein